MATLGGAGAAVTLLVALAVVTASARLASVGVVGLAALWTVAILVNPSAIAIGAGLGIYAVSELAFWAVELGPAGSTDERAGCRRWLLLGATVAVSVGIGGVVTVAAMNVAGTGVGLEAIGLAAIAGIEALVLVLTRRLRPESVRR